MGNQTDRALDATPESRRISRKHELLTILGNGSSYERFEALEHYATVANDEMDVLFLIETLQNDGDPMVRHEAAAQLLRLDTINPRLTVNNHSFVCNALVKAIDNDPSIIVKHEAMEALAYIGDTESLSVLERYIEDPNVDIRFTAKLAYKMLCFRLAKNISASNLGAAIGSR